MAAVARFSDGLEIGKEAFRLLARSAPGGTLDVFASDQHGSYKKLLDQFFKKAGIEHEAGDADVANVCVRFASRLGRADPSARPAAALFNELAFNAPGFRTKLTDRIMLIGRLESTDTVAVDGGAGQLAQTAIAPEEAGERVDAFKTLVKLNPDHPDSWKRNRDWLADVFERVCKLGKLLFNETLLVQAPGESKLDMARRLPDALVKMAEEFGTLGHFYKTQVPLLWLADGDEVTRVSSPDQVREAGREMDRIVPRPILLLSAAVDFEQYAAQYACVGDFVAGPMCGRAYFKEAFGRGIGSENREDENWEILEENFARIALPRVRQIKRLATALSQPWWGKFDWISDEVKPLIRLGAKPRLDSVQGDYAY